MPILFSQTKSAINLEARSGKSLTRRSIGAAALGQHRSERLLGAAAKFSWINDDSSIGIFHVLQRAFAETAAL